MRFPLIFLVAMVPIFFVFGLPLILDATTPKEREEYTISGRVKSIEYYWSGWDQNARVQFTGGDALPMESPLEAKQTFEIGQSYKVEVHRYIRPQGVSMWKIDSVELLGVMQ